MMSSLGRAASWVALIVFVIVVMFPIYWMVMTAIMPTDAILSRNPSLLPEPSRLRFDAFSVVLEASPFLVWMKNSVIVSVTSMALSLIVSTLAGYSLSRFRDKPQQVLGSTLLVSKLVPASLILIPLFIVYNLTGLFDTYLGLVLANMTAGVPLATWLMKSFFYGVPRELEQAAMIDGASQLQALRLVVLPLVKPGLGASAVYLMLNSWSEFIFARTLVASPDMMVLTVGMQSFVGEQQVDWPMLMAAGTLSAVPAMILFIFLEPFLVNGMTRGALAGT